MKGNILKKFFLYERNIFILILVISMFFLCHYFLIPQMNIHSVLKTVEDFSLDPNYTKNEVDMLVTEISIGELRNKKSLEKIMEKEKGSNEDVSENSTKKVVDSKIVKSFLVYMSKFPDLAYIEEKKDKDYEFLIRLKSSKDSLKNFFQYLDNSIANVEIRKIQYKKLEKNYEYEIIVAIF